MLVERRPVMDEYVEGGETVVLFADGRVLALSPLASAALAELGESRMSLAELAGRIVRRFGPPPGGDSAAATQALLVELSESGLVSLDPE